MSIPRKLIRQLCASGDTYLSGMRLFEEGQVKPGPETREDAIYHSDFLVSDPQGEMVVHLDLDNDNEMILSYNCCCEEFLTGQPCLPPHCGGPAFL